jgi:hypothetical protein
VFNLVLNLNERPQGQTTQTVDRIHRHT